MNKAIDEYTRHELARLTRQAKEAERLGFSATARAMRTVLREMHSSNSVNRQQKAGNAA